MEENNFEGLGNSITANRIRNYNWSLNPLGPVSEWPLSLKLYVSQIMRHQFPTLIIWGPEYIQIHNDAFLWSRDPMEEPPILGTKCPEYFEGTWKLVGSLIESVYKNGDSYFQEEMGFPDSRKDKIGKTAYYTYSYSPLKDEFGEIGGIMITSIETTSSVQAFKNLEEAEEIQRLALESADMGLFSNNLETGEVIPSDSHSRILGVPPILSNQDYRSLYVEEDLKIRDAAFVEAMKTGKLDFTARFIIQGKLRWIQALGKILYNNQNKPQKLIGVIHDITDKKIAEEKVLEANKSLQIAYEKQKELQKQKDQFLQIASHELRTPITTIKGFSQLLEETLMENGYTSESSLLARLNQRINHIHRLLESLFDFSKINAGKLEFVNEVFEITDVLREIVDDIRFTSTQHIMIEDYSFEAEVNFDRFRVSQVVTNLLSNAVKFSPLGSSIKISSRKMNDSVAVDVIDQGIGIPKEELNIIFEQYYRSSNLENSGIRGLGLGLFLSA